MEKILTEGEYRVGVVFNPSNNPVVDNIKQKTAELIDLIFNETDAKVDRDFDLFIEKNRLGSVAIERFEEGAMWAVKAVTKTKKDR